MVTMFKKLLCFSFVCLIGLLSDCYILKQGGYVLKYTTHSVPIKKLQNKKETPDSLKQYFSLINNIKRFATDSIGLKPSNNYSTFVSIQKSYLIDIVCAYGQVDFTPYTWCYPLMGCWPLRGYFDKKDALAEGSRLKAKGYDVYLGRVDAYSSLGFFSDPVYSFMERFSTYRMANLIIHELTHGTIYVKNQVDFNEELASFIGNEGALWFIRSTFGDTSAAYKTACNTAQDNTTYYRLMRVLYDRLSVVYNDSILTKTEKLTMKNNIISSFKDSLARNYHQLFGTNSYEGLEKIEINNAFIGVDMTYSKDMEIYNEVFDKCHRDLKLMMSQILSLKKNKGNYKENMRKLLFLKVTNPMPRMG